MLAVVTNTKADKPDFERIFREASHPAIVTVLYKADENGNKVDTKSTLIVASEEALRASKIDCRPYDFKKFTDPRSDKSQTWDIHVSGFPNNWTKKQAIDFLRTFLSPCFPQGWFAYFPVDRETGTIRGYGVMRFRETLTEDDVRKIKLVLHHKRIVPGTHLRVTWQVEQQTATSTVPATSSSVAVESTSPLSSL